MTSGMLFWIAVAATLATGLANFGQRSLRNFSRRMLEEVCRARGNLDRFGHVLREHERVALGVEHLASVAAGIALAAWFGWFEVRRTADGALTYGELASFAALAAVMLIATRTWFPWTGERLFAEKFLYLTWPVWKAAAVGAAPLTWSTHFGDALMHRLFGR
ncbi:MAG: hypothetical protein KDA61_04805, partial [Planctomycetales bacterium]|nr:hypothetical protein [Planctomycetales bacterium]